jgi:hypothetical protein
MLPIKLPSTLYLTWHGVGNAGSWVSPAEARYWNPVSVFAAALAAVPDIKARHGITVHMTFDAA